jgi:hypothetical protein
MWGGEAMPMGKRRWAIAEGWIPPDDQEKPKELVSHETACLLNVNDRDAHVQLTVFFKDRAPVGPYQITVPARRTLHVRFNDLKDPGPVPRGTDFASVIESDLPIVVQHTRLDSRTPNNGLATTVAYAEE